MRDVLRHITWTCLLSNNAGQTCRETGTQSYRTRAAVRSSQRGFRHEQVGRPCRQPAASRAVSIAPLQIMRRRPRGQGKYVVGRAEDAFLPSFFSCPLVAAHMVPLGNDCSSRAPQFRGSATCTIQYDPYADHLGKPRFDCRGVRGLHFHSGRYRCSTQVPEVRDSEQTCLGRFQYCERNTERNTISGRRGSLR